MTSMVRGARCSAPRTVSFVLAAVATLCLGPGMVAAQDAHETFTLPLDGSLVSTEGVAPIVASGVSFNAGISGQAAYFGAPNQVNYPAAGNLKADEGTLEFWMKPHWFGGDGQGHTVLRWGDGGGMLFVKDGANNLRCILNRYSVGGHSEAGVAVNIGNWSSGQWHHVAYSWSSAGRSLKMYVDGTLRSQATIDYDLPAIPDATFQVGADGAGTYLEAGLDDLRLSDIPRTAEEIGRDFFAGLEMNALHLSPDSLSLLETWRRTPTLTADTGIGTMSVPGSAVVWTVSDPLVARVDASGTVQALHAGHAIVTASISGQSDTMDLTVTAPVRPPTEETPDPYLTTPAADALFEMPVAVIRYIPTRDGVNVDQPVADVGGTVDQLKSYIDQLDLETKFMLEEMSRYHGYKDPSARHALGYRVVKLITVYEELPPDTNPAHGTGGSGIFFPDYAQVMERFNGRHLVEDLGVKEIWLWGYHHGSIAPVESDMSSPTTGDISNSNRFPDDLPVYGRTYVLYNYNFTRSSNESVHNHGHQLESILSHVNQRQDGNTDLFWKKFTGRDASGRPITGRCGNTHMPPNTTVDYDYWNTTPVPTDIEDWNPAGTGQKMSESATTWGSIPYAWPYGRNPGDPMQHNWYIYWGQAMPGLGSAIPYGGNTITDWWAYTGDWDAAVAAIRPSNGLYASGNVVPPEIGEQPADRTVHHGDPVVFHVTTTGPGDLTFLWRKGGRPLSDDSRTTGTTTDTLTLATASLADAGGYDVIVRSGGALVASHVALLTVLPSHADAATALRLAGGLEPASPGDIAAFDADGNGEIGLPDAALLLRMAER